MIVMNITAGERINNQRKNSSYKSLPNLILFCSNLSWNLVDGVLWDHRIRDPFVKSRWVRHFQESSYTQSRIKQNLTWGLWVKVRKIAGRIRIFVHRQEEWRTPRTKLSPHTKPDVQESPCWLRTGSVSTPFIFYFSWIKTTSKYMNTFTSR